VTPSCCVSRGTPTQVGGSKRSSTISPYETRGGVVVPEPPRSTLSAGASCFCASNVSTCRVLDALRRIPLNDASMADMCIAFP
jgi:hypothetical protein